MSAVGNTMRLRATPKAASPPAPNGKMFPLTSSAPSALWVRKSSASKNKISGGRSKDLPLFYFLMLM